MMKISQAVYNGIKELYAQIDWEKFEDLDRAINWELWHGPLPDNYWSYVEPLEHYVWQGFDKAVEDIIELLEPLPHKLWVDYDDCIYTSNPEDDEQNWGQITDDGDILHYKDEAYNTDEEAVWLGPEEYFSIDTRRYMMHDESWKQIF